MIFECLAVSHSFIFTQLISFLLQAYAHQYFEHGLEQGDFLEAFHVTGSVINSYMSL